MSRIVKLSLLLVSLCCCEVSLAQDAPADTQGAPAESEAAAAATSAADGSVTQSGGPGQVKTLSGMSILGNEEAPKSLVIVPWKSSELGDGISVNDLVDERARPVDKEVFLREVRYYQLRSGTAE